MKKASRSKDTLRSSYKRADFPGGFVRGKYAARAAASSNIVVLDPEVAEAFPTSASVNDALRVLLRAAKRAHP
jgi:septum formation inhibitor-activating ATPase MinD